MTVLLIVSICIAYVGIETIQASQLNLLEGHDIVMDLLQLKLTRIACVLNFWI